MKDIKKSYTLTPAETQVMNILWSMPDGGSVHDIVARYADPKPAYTTVATFLRILSNKGFVAWRRAQGKTHIYYVLVSKESYQRSMMKSVKDSLFNGSSSSLLEFFVREEGLTADEIRDLLDMINRENP